MLKEVNCRKILRDDHHVTEYPAIHCGVKPRSPKVDPAADETRGEPGL